MYVSVTWKVVFIGNVHFIMPCIRVLTIKGALFADNYISQ